MVGNDKRELISINLSIEGNSLDNVSSLFTNGKFQCIISDDIVADVELISTESTMGFDGSFLVQMIVSFATGVASGVIANFLYAKLLAGAKKLEINKKRTRITEEKITEAINTIQNYIIQTHNDEQQINEHCERSTRKCK